MSIAAVILAAGGGSRFAGPRHKLRAQFRGRPLVSWALDAALAAGLDETYVVTGAVVLDDLLPPEAVVITNHSWADGQAVSIQAALATAGRDGHDAVVIGLGDQPLVPAEAWKMVAEEPGELVTATFRGQRRPPTKIASSLWPLVPLSGDEGGRAVMRARPDAVREVPCPGEPVDIDTLEDLTRWS